MGCASTTSRTAPLPGAVMAVLRALPADANPMDALRTALSAWGATQQSPWPPTVERRARSRRSHRRRWPRSPDCARPGDRSSRIRRWTSSAGFLYQLTGERPDAGAVRALEAYFIVGAEHSFNASTFTARVIASTQSDIASAICRRDRRAQGSPARRRAERGGRSAGPGRVGGCCRAVDAMRRSIEAIG